MAWMRTLRLLSEKPACLRSRTPAAHHPQSRGPGGSQAVSPRVRSPARPESCPDGPARAYLGTHPRRAASPPPTPATGAQLRPARPPPRLRKAPRAARSQPPPGRRDCAGRAGGGEVRLGRARRARPWPGACRGRGAAPPRRLPSPSRLPGSAPGGNDVLLPG